MLSFLNKKAIGNSTRGNLIRNDILEMSENESPARKEDIRVNIHQRSSKVAVILTEIFFRKNTDCSE